MKIVLIATMNLKRVIEKKGSDPWVLPEVSEHFEKLTVGHVCIFDQKTYESLPVKPLPGRTCCIISKTLETGLQGDATFVFSSLADCIGLCEYKQVKKEIYVCGGEEIYEEALKIATDVELTIIDNDIDVNTHFPYAQMLSSFQIVNTTQFSNGSFRSYTRKN